jgi:hypothetical protein
MAKWTIKSLFQSGIRVSQGRINPPSSPSIRLDKIIPFAGTNSVLFQLTLKGVTELNSSGYPVNHKVNLFFYGVDIKRVEVKGYIKVTDNTGDYWFNPPNANNTNVKVRCTCKDHYFTFGIWNFNQGAIFGNKPRPYKRLTPPPPNGYPYRNVNQYCGIDKHITNSVKYLQNTKMMK